MSKKLTVFVDGPYGLAEGKIIWMVEQDVVFWCREELRLGSRPRARVDIGPNQVDIEIHVREHLVPEITQIPTGFVFVGRYTVISKADEVPLYKVLRRINKEGMAAGQESLGGGSLSNSFSSAEIRKGSQSWDSNMGLHKKESQELLLWHLGRKKMSHPRTARGSAVSQDEKRAVERSRAPMQQDVSEAPEPTDPAERMRVAREALKGTATDRRPLFESQDDLFPPHAADGTVGFDSGEQSRSYSSAELAAPAQKAAARTRPAPGGGKEPPRKGKAHRALQESIEILRARATSEPPLAKKATESSTFGFKREGLFNSIFL